MHSWFRGKPREVKCVTEIFWLMSAAATLCSLHCFLSHCSLPAQLLIKLFCLGKFVAKEAVDLMILDTKMDPNASLSRWESSQHKYQKVSSRRWRISENKSQWRSREASTTLSGHRVWTIDWIMPCAPLKLILTLPPGLPNKNTLSANIHKCGAGNVCALKIRDFFRLSQRRGGRSFWKSATAWNFYMRFSFDGIILIKARSWKFKVEAEENRKVPIGVACMMRRICSHHLLHAACASMCCVYFYLFMYLEFVICVEARIPCLRSLYDLGWWTFLFFSQL